MRLYDAFLNSTACHILFSKIQSELYHDRKWFYTLNKRYVVGISFDWLAMGLVEIKSRVKRAVPTKGLEVKS